MNDAVDLLRWRRWLVLLFAAGVVGVPADHLVGRAAGMTALANGPSPYFVAGHALTLYLLVPLAVLSSLVLYLLPGLMLAVVAGWATSMTAWTVTGMLLSLVVVSVTGGVATAVAGGPVEGIASVAVTLGVAAVCAALADRQVHSGRRRAPACDADERWTIVLMVLLPLITYWLMSPKFLWETLNGDGVHAFESSRRLVRHAFPFWPVSAGPVSHFPGMTSMLFAFPNAYFFRLFGEIDAAARLPFLLYLPVLFSGLLALGSRDGRRVAPLTQAAVAVGLLAYAYAMAYSATYNPYSADIALPATQDTLLMVCFVAAAGAYWRRDWGMLWLSAGLTYLSLPSGLILMGFLLVADLLVTRPVPWRQGVRLATTILGCAIGAAILARAVVLMGSPAPGREYGTFGILRYFAFLQFTDWTRLALVVVPAGILPYIMMFRWPVLDRASRALMLVTVAYFLFFYVQANISLHHFVPAMLLPVPMALRAMTREPRAVSRWSLAWLGAAAASVLFSLPRTFAVETDGRAVGRAVSVNTGDYAKSDAAVFASSFLLNRLFPYDWDPLVPFAAYGGSPLSWNRYALHGLPSDSTAYAIVPVGAAAPAGMRLVASDSTGMLYLRDEARWMADLARRPATPAGSSTYFVPRSILFRAVPHHGSPPIVDVVATLESWGVDVDPILARLGVKR